MGSKPEIFLIFQHIRSSLHQTYLPPHNSVQFLKPVEWHSFVPTYRVMVSSTYFHNSVSGMSSSSVMTMNNHGPSLVPWGTPSITAPHSEKQSWPSLTDCVNLNVRNIHAITAMGLSNECNFLIRIWWSMRSNQEHPYGGPIPIHSSGSIFASTAGLT